MRKCVRNLGTYFLPVFSHNFARAPTRICLNETGLDKEGMQITWFVPGIQRSGCWKREMPGFPWEPRGSAPLETGPPGEMVALLEAERSKALSCFSGGKLWSVLPLTASTNTTLKALCSAENCLNFLLCISYCVFLHKTILFHSQTRRSFKKLSDSAAVNWV